MALAYMPHPLFLPFSVLNMAREANPQEELVWITAARLEEANGNAAAVHKILEKAVASLQHYGVVLDRIKVALPLCLSLS
jgi:hypothetical protein